MSEYEAVYNVRLTKDQLAALKANFGIAVEVADRFGGGDYNIEVLDPDSEVAFVEWCDDQGIEAKLV